MKQEKGRKAIVLYGDSETDANMLYATRIFVPDPFVYFRTQGRSFMIVSDLEYSRAMKEASVDHVLSQQEIMREISPRKRGLLKAADMLIHIFREKGIARIEVPRTFPVGLADELRDGGIVVRWIEEPFFRMRAVKNRDEIKHIRQVLRAAEYGMKAALKTLKEARIVHKKNNALVHGGTALTADRMREIIHRAVGEKDCTAKHTIVACGIESYDPHQRGKGRLVANQPIIVDIFPRSNQTGYYGDMTRTFVKGEPSEWVQRAYGAVREGQNIALSNLYPGIQGKGIHMKITKFFTDNGFPTEKVGDRMVGFFHGTGHGLGLALHEYPWIGQRPCRLEAGHVVTVEPGIYYPEIGGVRLEDVVWLTDDGPQLLTHFPKVLKV